MPIRILKKDEDKKEDKKKKPKGSSKLDIFKSYGKYDGKPVELKAGGLTGNQHKLDKNKDGKISGQDFKMMKRKKGGVTKKNPNSPKGQNPVSEYDRKGKLKYTAANQGGMMAKSTRGYGAARKSGMGLQDEKIKDNKVKPVKAVLGIAAMGLMGAKYLKDRKKKKSSGAPMIGAAAELYKKKKQILGKKTGGPIGKKSTPGNMMSTERTEQLRQQSRRQGLGSDLRDKFTKPDIEKIKQQINRFKNKSTKGGGADASKIMSDKTKQSIKDLVKRIGRSIPKKPKGPKPRTMKPLKKMGGGMMMKQYNKGGSVTASCKLGRNKATKLY